MAKDNNTTPAGADPDDLFPQSEPMIVDGKVVYGEPTAQQAEPDIAESEIVTEGGRDYVDAPTVRPRNGMANAGMFLAAASLLMNPFGVTSVVAIVASVIGLRRSISMFNQSGSAVGRIPATIGLAVGIATGVFALWIYITQPEMT